MPVVLRYLLVRSTVSTQVAIWTTLAVANEAATLVSTWPPDFVASLATKLQRRIIYTFNIFCNVHIILFYRE